MSDDFYKFENTPHGRRVIQWRKDNESKLLTQEQVDALPEGTTVELIWSGGNGPHTECVEKRNGKTVVCGRFQDGTERYCHYVDFVGNERFNTQVILK